MKKILLLASIAAFLAACSSGPKFDLEVNISNNNSLINKELVIHQQIDGAIVYSDTTKIKKEQFQLKIPYKGPALIFVSVPESNINEIMMAAEEGIVHLDIEGAKSHIGGTPLNERLQAFYNGNDSVSLLFQQLDKETSDFELQNKPASLTPKMKAELQQKRDEFHAKRTQLLIANTDRIIAFIKENVNNPVGEYYFMTNYITLPLERKLEMNSFATEKLKKEFGLQ
ncbi:MAG: DUF4369 domain-containing protein [Candidatus Azobacteroides sp.]|nr:DUF4369 domain-containing protein [Candidatus Azobacteroides sp.]